MLEHIIILLNIATLIVGTWAVFYFGQLYKSYKIPFLKPLVYYILFFNLLILLFSVSNYFKINLLQDDSSAHSQSYHIVVNPITCFVCLGLEYSFLGVTMKLLGRSISVNIRRLFFTGLMVVILSYSIGITIYIQSASFRWLFYTEVFLILLYILIVYAFLIVLISYRGADSDANNKKTIHAFGYLYLAGYTFPVFIFIFPYPENKYAVSLFFLLINFIPFIWFNRFFTRTHSMAVSSFQDQIGLERICKQYNISKREREIIGLILQGKSNKEIEEDLFISVHTVKNHVHNLYRKLNVKSRGQLVHFILNHKESKQ